MLRVKYLISLWALETLFFFLRIWKVIKLALVVLKSDQVNPSVS
jgi:hypothetical protein